MQNRFVSFCPIKVPKDLADDYQRQRNGLFIFKWFVEFFSSKFRRLNFLFGYSFDGDKNRLSCVTVGSSLLIPSRVTDGRRDPLREKSKLRKLRIDLRRGELRLCFVELTREQTREGKEKFPLSMSRFTKLSLAVRRRRSAILFCRSRS